MAMYIEVDEKGILKIVGKLTSDNALKVQNHLNELLFTRNHLVLDITEVDYIDIPGIYMLFQFKNKAQQISKEVNILLNKTSCLNDIINRSGLKTILD
ncbi:STAS domain-containing protein [Gramella sp. MAR_2010_147]|uniref:STAS domain-containing protein n=1 Tax=Gramella sp. MAR_2010_147 TaxID=1250205 RepID=UPI000B7F07AB|nr:STAS domain-containing protein [Gramella sp. MAR_2010_147]